jgi:nicotinate-nucleotide--dimethylbenzimidazole phosphoribosyltransferase
MTFNIPVFDCALKTALLQKINNKTKPLGALGDLEMLALQVGLIQSTLCPVLREPTMLVFAGDHGVTHEKVSPYPQAVTAQMVLNFLQGGAAINVFAKQNNMVLRVIDSGVNYVFEQMDGLIDAKVGYGTSNFAHESAMTKDACQLAISQGASIMDAEIAQGCNVVGFGEMGIGNTSSASCLMAVLCDIPIADCVGRGTGLDGEGLAHKLAVLAQALDFHRKNNRALAHKPMQVLATFGGYEIAMMVGAMLRAAEQKCVLIIDGFITTAALLVAAKLQPTILQYCVFSHASNEAGHYAMLEYLKAKPLLQLGLRLGEGTAAALAYPLLQAAVNFLNEMASFSSANVSAAAHVD